MTIRPGEKGLPHIDPFDKPWETIRRLDVIPWPDPEFVTIQNRGRHRFYRTPVGLCPSVTTVLKILGLSKEALIAWSAKEERKATIEAACQAAANGFIGNRASFTAAIERELGPAKQHLKLIAKAADIGSQVHDMIRWTLTLQLGEPVGDRPVLSDPALWAYMAWEDWWKSSGLKPVRIEQPIYHPTHKYAGTIDLLAEGKDGLELWDWKSSKGVYEEHHLQAVAYLYAARQFSPVVKATIGHLPKTVEDPKFEVIEVGDFKDGRLDESQLIEAFLASLKAWNILCGRET